MPICTSQGQISSGRAWMVTARVALNVGCLTTSSPGMARPTSSSVAPHRSCQGRMKRRYTPNKTTPRAANPIPNIEHLLCSYLCRRLNRRCWPSLERHELLHTLLHAPVDWMDITSPSPKGPARTHSVTLLSVVPACHLMTHLL